MSRLASRGLFAQVEAYFTEYLPKQRGASLHTVRAYRDALTLLLRFVADQRGRGVASLQLSDIDVDAVTLFLDHIELQRSNTAATRNCRRAAIRGFFKHLLRNPIKSSLNAVYQKRAEPAWAEAHGRGQYQQATLAQAALQRGHEA